jgi:hypothetical protein
LVLISMSRGPCAPTCKSKPRNTPACDASVLAIAGAYSSTCFRYCSDRDHRFDRSNRRCIWTKWCWSRNIGMFVNRFGCVCTIDCVAPATPSMRLRSGERSVAEQLQVRLRVSATVSDRAIMRARFEV